MSALSRASHHLVQSARELADASVPDWARDARDLLVAEISDCGRRLKNFRHVVGDPEGDQLEHVSQPLGRLLDR